MPDITRFVAIAVVAAVLASVGGCASNAPTNFYVLSSLSGTTQESSLAPTRSRVTIGVGPVTLPGYIDRDGIVTRDGHNVLDIAEFDQWAEPLHDNVPQVLGENLALLVPSDNVVYYPWQGPTAVDYQVVVDVSRFEADSDDMAVLIAQWTIVSGDGEKELLVRKSQWVEPAGSADMRSKVAALNLTLEKMSRDIASAIRDLWGR